MNKFTINNRGTRAVIHAENMYAAIQQFAKLYTDSAAASGFIPSNTEDKHKHFEETTKKLRDDPICNIELIEPAPMYTNCKHCNTLTCITD